MYRDSIIYEDITQTIIDIYIDYNIRSFPISAKEVCDKLGVILMPYSNYPPSERTLLEEYSKFGFFVSETKENPPIIFYNDKQETIEGVRFTIFHELKHYVYEDTDDSDDDIAEYFARYFMCPIPHLLFNNIWIVDDIERYCKVSHSAAENTASNIRNRKKKYGMKIFDNEKRLIEHLNAIIE